MESRRRPSAASVANSRTERSRGSTSSPRLRVAVLFCSLGALLAIGGLLIASAAATPGCGPAQSTSADGTVAYGTSCSDEIVITSPLVEKVFAGEGDDVIYANAEVEEIYGGEGNDVIHGELSAIEAGTGVEYQPEYETPSGGEAEGALEGAASASSMGSSPRRQPLATVSNKVECTTSPCYGGDGSQEMFGGRGGDEMFGERGNDTLHGEDGNDMLYGGIGDDSAFGDNGYDMLSGGLGTDLLDGKDGNDTVRGDGTVDVLRDSGGKGDVDTLSYATAVAPGFHGAVSAKGFPADAGNEERGVEVRLDGAAAGCGVQACNNDARYGGGGDEISVSGFENVFGSPFADRIVGSAAANRIDGGGGADVIEGGGGDDRLFGGADGDYMSGGDGKDRTFFGEAAGNNCATDVEVRTGCSSSAAEVHQRDRSKIEVGYISPPVGGTESVALYLVGSEAADVVSVKAAFGGLGGSAAFIAEPGSASFDTSPAAASPNCDYKPSEVKCGMPTKADVITLAGMAGDDRLNLATDGTVWRAAITPVLLGGEGNDTLFGSGQTEDVLVDGPGEDSLSGFGFDDALLNNEGFDRLEGGSGSDLLLSSTTCEGDILRGAEGKKGDPTGVNSASWAALPESSGGVVADLKKGTAGSQYDETIVFPTRVNMRPGNGKGAGKEKGDGPKPGRPACSSGDLDRLGNIDDLEGSNQSDALFGDTLSNNLLGRKGEDNLYARGGDDSIEAQDGEQDDLVGGGGEDICSYDKGLDTVKHCDPNP